MKKFLAILTVLFILQLLLPAAGSPSFIKPELTPAGQGKATSVRQRKTSVGFADTAEGISVKNVNILFNDAGSLTQDATKYIKSNDVSNGFKQSAESNTVVLQSGSSYWAKTYGGGGNDEATSIQQTKDGGYIVAGWTDSFGVRGEDILVIKLDSSGNLSWAKTYGGGGNDEATSIQQTKDGGYIVAGWTDSFGVRGEDILVIKLDSSGNLSWAKTYGGGGNDEATSIQQTKDGGYIVAGWTESFDIESNGALVIKLDSDGNLTWAKTYVITYEGSDNKIYYGANYATSIQQTKDGGYIVAGWTDSFGVRGEDILVIKLDSSGNLSWAKAFGGGGNDEATSVQQTTDGGYVVAGQIRHLKGNAYEGYPLVIKLDSKGNPSWAKMFDEDGYTATSIQQTKDGGYIVAISDLEHHYYNFDIVKLTSDGRDFSWARGFGSANSYGDTATSVQQTTDGGYVVAGWSSYFGAGDYDFLVLKLDWKGNIPGGSCKFLVDSTPYITFTTIPLPVLHIDTVVATPTISIFSQTPSISSPDVSVSTICASALLKKPSPPQNLSVISNNANKSVTLSWAASSQGTYPLAGYVIYRGEEKGKEDFSHPIATVAANTTQYTDKTVEVGKTYYYVVKAFDNQTPPNYSKPSNEVSITIPSPPPIRKTVIILQPDNPIMSVNGVKKEIDPGRGTKPVIIPKWGRTVVPIRAIVEALGGTIEWDGVARKVTIHFNGNTVELWIDNPRARVNGTAKWIDPNNHDVKPIIINDRTMLPLRFVAESLGCKVDWNGATRTITITYTP